MTEQNLSHVLTWNRLACDAIEYTQTPITIAARALAMVHTAMYDAWTAFTAGPEASTTSGCRFKHPDKKCTWQNREEAYSFAAYRVLEHLFANNLPEEHKDLFTACMRDLGYDPENSSENPNTAAGMGNLAARLVIECRKGDGSNEENDYVDFTGYKPANKPPPKRPLNEVDRWQPRLGANRKPQEFLTPHWGVVTPFALNWGGQCRPAPPITCDSNAFNAQREEIKQLSACLDDSQKLKAEFWSGMHEEKYDASCAKKEDCHHTVLPVQCCRILQYIAEKNEFQNTNAIRLFFAVTNALFDTTIAVWDAKEHYDYARPESMIHELDDNTTFDAWGGPGQGTVSMQGEGWCPYVLSNPPYAEYVSAHSALMYATADIITCYCGNADYGKSISFAAGSSAIEPEVVPAEEVEWCWYSVYDAAEEAGLSRLYAGTNFTKSHEQGRELGKDVARLVWQKVLLYFEGC